MASHVAAARRYLDSAERRSAAAQRFAVERSDESAKDYVRATAEEASARQALVSAVQPGEADRASAQEGQSA